MVLDGEGGFLSVCMFIFLGLRCHPRTGKAHSLDQTLPIGKVVIDDERIPAYFCIV